MSYNSELSKAMEVLSQKDKTIFLGQNIIHGGIAIAESLKFIPLERKIEMPIAENLQMGISIGLSLEGFIPISIYPRWNFLILAADQLVNHLDKIQTMTNNEFTPKVIIRVASGVKGVIDPQEQHVGDFTEAFQLLLKNITLVKLTKEEDIVKEYLAAYYRIGSTILVEEHQF